VLGFSLILALAFDRLSKFRDFGSQPTGALHHCFEFQLQAVHAVRERFGLRRRNRDLGTKSLFLAIDSR